MASPKKLMGKAAQSLAIVSAGFCRGAPKAGTDAGPSAILDSGLFAQLQRHFTRVQLDNDKLDGADLPQTRDPDFAGMKNPRAVSAATKYTSERAYNHSRNGSLVLTLGGDHSNAIGSLTGASKGLRERTGSDFAVICVDAHVSINTPETSPSGNINGMPLAFATGIAKTKGDGIFNWIQKEHQVDVKRLVYVGTRDVDDAEKETIKAHGIKVFDMERIRRNGIENVMDEVLDYVGSSVPIHLSCDIDALDPEWGPSAGHLVPDGLALEEGQYIARRVSATNRLAAMDLVEVNPSINLPGVQRTVDSACALIKSAFGISDQ
ncbi:arginase [Aspergillus steynii IBT 23096]|uniref:Arginase n=1 Tax=Aspergillus steynii IBT 23096 TaxID=1392250 RepID=A0A2I2G613_9EURO|nr:arginase [Aspergillus steynii IBT 23096]PLB48310.1 arginase [Aspergillus steynii IBT 23096]